MSDLYRRLKAAKERSDTSGQSSNPKKRSVAGNNSSLPRSDRPSAVDHSVSEGFAMEGGVYVRRESIPLERLDSRATLLAPDDPVYTPLRLGRPRGSDAADPSGAGGAEKRPSAAPPRLGGHLFFDLEATGLSTGAGNVAFLLGLGRRTPGAFELTQWLLPDYPYEPELLLSVASELQRLEETLGGLTLVSYNGRSFDTPLLRTRMLMNGIPFEPPRELDLLPISRRFWRHTLPDCSLGTVERGVLSLERELDVPGAFVPLRYFDYLQTGRAEPLLEVIAHHRQDIVSLYLLLSGIEGTLRGEGTPGGRHSAGSRGWRPDPFELAKLLIEREPLPGAMERGEAILGELTMDGGDERASLYYGRRLRRRGETKAAYEVWSRAFRRTGSAAAGIMAAKVLEHEFQEFGAALSLVEALLPRLTGSPRLRSSLLHRQERLRRRVASS